MHKAMERLYLAARTLKLIGDEFPQKDFASLLNTSPQRVGNWEKRGPSKEIRLQVQADYGISATWVQTGGGEMLIAKNRDLLPSSNTDAALPAVESNVSPGPDMKARAPLISWVQAGMWTEICDNFQPGDAETWLECHKDLGPHGYALRVKGHSMTAPGGGFSFPEGMLLYVNPEAEPLPGRFVIVRRSGHEATFKRLCLVDGELYLEALNPDWPNRYIRLTEHDHFCGVVLHAGFEMP